jgi:methyltransferase (TIGR00027 family)
MEPTTPSETALLAAKSRARHQVLDGGRVFHDPLALRIIGKQAAEEIMTSPRRSESRIGRALRGPLAARSRIAEDTLHAAVAAGARQYVLLGAGLDTFAYRNPYGADTLRVFEVDHPATQATKRRQLAEAHIAVPASLAFVGVDFETQDFVQGLQAAGFDPTLPTVYSWLGVAVYLPRQTVMSTLKSIRESSAPGSVLVFDYVSRPGRLDLLRRGVLALMARRFARIGEPWRTFFDEQELAGDLRAIGYSRVEDLRAADIAKSLFDGNGVLLKHRYAGRKFGGVIRAWA